MAAAAPASMSPWAGMLLTTTRAHTFGSRRQRTPMPRAARSRSTASTYSRAAPPTGRPPT
eukprot:scaffold36931_cov37-Phaeocystis_antarctica.AAC.2